MKLRIQFKLIPIFLCAVLMAGCHSGRSERPVVTPMNYSLMLSEEQIEQLTKKAQLGDGTAAFKLYEYYSMMKLDRRTALKWLIKAAEDGHNVAQYNLGVVYSGELYPETKDIEKAKYWFRKAADNGDTEAKRKLEQLESESKQ